MLRRLVRPFDLVPISEYDIVMRWYQEKRDECQRWEVRVDFLQSQLDEAKHLVEVLQAQVDHLNEQHNLALEEIGRKTGEIRMLGDKLALAEAIHVEMGTVMSEPAKPKGKRTREGAQ